MADEVKKPQPLMTGIGIMGDPLIRHDGATADSADWFVAGGKAGSLVPRKQKIEEKEIVDASNR